jgi:hypothetical protein
MAEPEFQARLRLAFLICSHIVVCCVSLVFVANYRYVYAFSPPSFHIFYDPERLRLAIAVVATFVPVSALFLISRFSFGYFVGFYFYTMILSYLWINCFTDLSYDHRLSGLSAAISAVAFLAPALFISSPVRPAPALSTESFDRLLTLILALGAITAALGAFYNFQLVAMGNVSEYRETLETPALLNYLWTIVSSALLPFAFAGFVARRANWRAAGVLAVLLLFYPITLTKITLFAPAWLIVMVLLSRLFPVRTAVVASLLIPMLAGLVLLALFGLRAAPYFVTVNFRMVAIPAVAMDVYNDFFSTHDLTHFCQISVLKRIMNCPYQEQLSLVMKKAYNLGNFNGSLFVTEGIASVGRLFAPVAAFACGLVIALGNRLSAGLPAGFVLVSGAVLPLVLLNVPLSVALLTHGAGLLFILWYITPRAIFAPTDRTDA